MSAERRNRNLTIIEAKKNSPLHARRNTAAPALSSQNPTLISSQYQDNNNNDNSTWKESTIEEYPPEQLEEQQQEQLQDGVEGVVGGEAGGEGENYNWYNEQYEEYGYQEWNGEYPQDDQQYYQQQEGGGGEEVGVPVEEQPYLQEDNYPPINEDQGNYSNNLASQPEQQQQIQEQEDGEGGDSSESNPDLQSYEINIPTPLIRHLSVSTSPSKPPTNEILLKLKQSEILYQQALETNKILQTEKVINESKLIELAEVNNQQREEINQLRGENSELKEIETQLKKDLEEIRALHQKQKEINEEQMNKINEMEANYKFLQNQLIDLQETYRLKELAIHSQYQKDTVTISIQTDTDPLLHTLHELTTRLHELHLFHNEEILQHKLQIHNFISQHTSLRGQLTQKDQEINNQLNLIANQMNEIKLLEMKLKASNYEIESINKLLKQESERITGERDLTELLQRREVEIQELNLKINENKIQMSEMTAKVILLKKKVAAYKEINCLTCGGNFYESILKLRNKFQREELGMSGGLAQPQGQGQGSPNDFNQREVGGEEKRDPLTLNANIATSQMKPSHKEEITRIGVNGIRKLRVQSANERERGRRRKMSPNNGKRHHKPSRSHSSHQRHRSSSSPSPNRHSSYSQTTRRGHSKNY